MAIAEHLQRIGVSARVRPALTNYYQVEYDASRAEPLVSVIVPSNSFKWYHSQMPGLGLGKITLQEFRTRGACSSGSCWAAERDKAFAKVITHPRVRVVEYEDQPFNFSRVSNLGARSSGGSILCFLNDDVEVISKDWLERFVTRVKLEDVGAVGALFYYPSNAIQHAGVILGVDKLADHAWKHWPRRYAEYFGRGALEEVYSCVTAACMAAKRDFRSRRRLRRIVPGRVQRCRSLH